MLVSIWRLWIYLSFESKKNFAQSISWLAINKIERSRTYGLPCTAAISLSPKLFLPVPHVQAVFKLSSHVHVETFEKTGTFAINDSCIPNKYIFQRPRARVLKDFYNLLFYILCRSKNVFNWLRREKAWLWFTRKTVFCIKGLSSISVRKRSRPWTRVGGWQEWTPFSCTPSHWCSLYSTLPIGPTGPCRVPRTFIIRSHLCRQLISFLHGADAWHNTDTRFNSVEIWNEEEY